MCSVPKSCPHGVPSGLSACAGVPGPCLHAVGVFRLLPAYTSVPSLHSHIIGVRGPLHVCPGIPVPHLCDTGMLTPCLCVPGSPVPVAVRVPVPTALGFPVGVSQSLCPLHQDPWSPACVNSVPIPMVAVSLVPHLCMLGSLLLVSAALAFLIPSLHVQGLLSPFPCHWDPQSPACMYGIPCPHSRSPGVPVLFLPVLGSLVSVTLGSLVPAHASFPCPCSCGTGVPIPCPCCVPHSTCAQRVLSRAWHEGTSTKIQCPLSVPTVGGDVGWDERDALRSLLGTPPCSLLCQHFNLGALSSM